MEELKLKRAEWIRKHILPLIKSEMTQQEIDNVVCKVTRKIGENPELGLDPYQLFSFFKREDVRTRSVQRIELRFEENRAEKK